PSVLRVEAVARYEHEAAQEAPEGVASDEKAEPLALAEVEDAHGDLEQLASGRLEELVPRVRLQDFPEGLLVVAVGREVGLVEDGLDLAPEDRDLGWFLAVGRGGVEAEEAALSDGFALVVEALDADVVEVGGAVDCGAGVRLGQREEVGLEGKGSHSGREAVEARRGLLLARLSEDAEAGAGHGVERELAFCRV